MAKTKTSITITKIDGTEYRQHRRPIKKNGSNEIIGERIKTYIYKKKIMDNNNGIHDYIQTADSHTMISDCKQIIGGR